MMANTKASIAELVGKTPLVELRNFQEKYGLQAKLFAKLEYLNPSGSVKDRAALNMITEAEKAGKLQKGDTIVDNSSGNTGIALAAFAAAKGYHFECLLEPGVSPERTQILKAYGAHLRSFLDFPEIAQMMDKGAFETAEISRIIQAYADSKGYFYTDQVSNQANPEAHYQTTGPEIWEDTDGQVDILIMAAGTGGTIAGLAQYFRQKKPDIKIIAVEPAEASRPSAEQPDVNSIDGIVAFDGFGPENQPTFFSKNHFYYDSCIDVLAEDGYKTGLELARTDGIFLGESAGAVLHAAKTVAQKDENKGKNIVLIFADNGMKYLSSPMYQEIN
ncbi:PLP-dependent cysteine synthase family protein [Streptococcus sp. H49]|uniref:PLP-dependent cysteine synthase family protein n=1 Tax=Streptococcus huangxiaojuni TaxID=3237239 RepID=UPI0034A19A8A